MFIRALRLENLLSFGPTKTELTLKPLNVLIGPNGSGKSNLIDAIGLLQAAPGELAAPIAAGGGIREWLWKGGRNCVASVEALIEQPASPQMAIRHVLEFAEVGQRFNLIDERIENEKPYPGKPEPYFYYRFQDNHPVLNVLGNPRSLRREEVDPQKSILAQRRDPDQYPEITRLAECYGRIKIYRDWIFGRFAPPRLPQRTDDRNDVLREDCSNLGLVLNRLRRNPPVKTELLERLGDLYPGVKDFDSSVEGGTVQLFLEEDGFSIPATRLSDGTLRYCCLLAILCNPKPPPLVCIEEPELGLHPDAVESVGRLIKDASLRMQLVVSTHSEIIVDTLTETAEDVVVCERRGGESVMRRLDSASLKDWLKRYSLGELWLRGEIGGTR